MAKQKIVNDQDIVELEYKEHLLLRPGMYVGSTVETEVESWIIDDDDKLTFKKVKHVPAAVKVCNEIIDNSLDEFTKTNGKYATKINVLLNETTCSVEDNGRGIPVKKTEKGEWMPMVAFCNGMAGSNFKDENRQSLGQNGTGAKCTNFLSKYFEVVTCDGKGKLKIVCKDNADSVKVTELTPTDKTGTKVTFTPDFKRFGIDHFDDKVISLIKTRLKILSWCHPNCNITFNGEKMGVKLKDISALFPQPFICINNDNTFIGVYPSDEPYILTYVNGQPVPKGGTHVDYIVNKIVADVREKVSKKLKKIKPSDIKNRLSFVILLTNFPNCRFTSQEKTELANAPSEIGEFLRANVDLDVLSTKVLKDKVILDNITDIFKAKEEIAANKEAEKKSNKRDFDSNKYFPPIGKSGEKYLMITEGQSAFSGISPILGRKGIGYYMLMGKPANILNETPSKFMEHREIAEIIQVLGLSPTRPNENIDMTYDKVVILSDADADGTAIAGLIISIFSKIAPKMLEEGRICRMETPLLIGLGKGDKVEEYYFSFPEKSKMKSNLEYKYLKGLGSWTKGRLNQVIEKEGGMDGLIRPYKIDETTLQTIQEWFGKETIARKDALRGREFHIDIA